MVGVGMHATLVGGHVRCVGKETADGIPCDGKAPFDPLSLDECVIVELGKEELLVYVPGAYVDVELNCVTIRSTPKTLLCWQKGLVA